MKKIQQSDSPEARRAAADTAADIMAWYGEVRSHLAAGRAVEFSPKGYSMWPALRPGADTVRLEAAAEYRRSDIVLALCREPQGVFMHRIAEVLPAGYVLAGDSNLYMLERCGPGDIAGKVTAIRRRGRDVYGSAGQRVLARIQGLPPALRRIFVRAVKLYINRIPDGK